MAEVGKVCGLFASYPTHVSVVLELDSGGNALQLQVGNPCGPVKAAFTFKEL